jgi:hypothetical protein
MPMMQPIHKGAPTAAIAAKKISIPGTRSPSGRVPLGTRVSLGIRNKEIAIKPKIAKGTAAKAIFVHEVERGSRFANTYEPHPAMVASKVHMTMIPLIPSVCTLLSNAVSNANVYFA